MRTAPRLGRRRRLQDSLATMRTHDQLSVKPLWPGPTRLPRLVARGYLAVVLPDVHPVRSTFLRRKARVSKTRGVINSWSWSVSSFAFSSPLGAVTPGTRLGFCLPCCAGHV